MSGQGDAVEAADQGGPIVEPNVEKPIGLDEVPADELTAQVELQESIADYEERIMERPRLDSLNTVIRDGLTGLTSQDGQEILERNSPPFDMLPRRGENILENAIGVEVKYRMAYENLDKQFDPRLLDRLRQITSIEELTISIQFADKNLASLMGNIDTIESRLEHSRVGLLSRSDDLSMELEGKFDQLQSQIDHLKQKLESQQSQLKTLLQERLAAPARSEKVQTKDWEAAFDALPNDTTYNQTLINFFNEAGDKFLWGRQGRELANSLISFVDNNNWQQYGSTISEAVDKVDFPRSLKRKLNAINAPAAVNRVRAESTPKPVANKDNFTGIEFNINIVSDNDEFLLNQETLTNLGIVDQSVSRVHAKISKIGNTYQLTDIGRKENGSTNGTYLNGDRLVKNVGKPLKNGDIVQIGDSDYFVSISTEATGKQSGLSLKRKV